MACCNWSITLWPHGCWNEMGMRTVLCQKVCRHGQLPRKEPNHCQRDPFRGRMVDKRGAARRVRGAAVHAGRLQLRLSGETAQLKLDSVDFTRPYRKCNGNHITTREVVVLPLAVGLRFVKTKRSPTAATSNRALEGSHLHATDTNKDTNACTPPPFCPSCPAAAPFPSMHFHFSKPHTFLH